MPDLGVQSPNDLYPKPPAPPSQGALSDPTRLIDLFGAITRNQMLQNELKGRAAVGQAVQGALGPGGFDIGAFTNSLKNNPDAAWMAPEALQQGQNNARAQFERMMAIQQQVRQLGGSLSDNPSKEELYNAFTTAVRGGVPPAEAAEMLSAVSGARNKSAVISQFRNFGLTPLEQSQRTEIQPGPSGVRQTAPLTGANRAGVIGTTQPIGEAESQVAAAAGAASLEATGPKTAQIHADLENLRQLNKDIPVQGPTAEFEKKLNQVGARLGIGVTMTADQLRKAEEFDKIANQLSLNQSTLFHGSDATGRTVLAANPSLGQSRYGREGVIDMLQGNQDAVDRARGIWLAARRAGAPASSFNQFTDRISKEIDPRVFQFNRISKENQQKFLDDMDPSELPEFERKYRDAISKGWVKPLKGAAQPQAEPSVPAPAKPAPKPGKQSQAEPPVPGARRAADGQWYVRQPHENGEYQRVVMNA